MYCRLITDTLLFALLSSTCMPEGMFGLYTCKYTKKTPGALGCMNIWVEEVMGRLMRLWVEAAGQSGEGWGVEVGCGGSGGTGCHQAAVNVCWPAVCYLLQHWLASQRGVCKVGQHIIYLPPLLLPSVTISQSSSCSPFTNADSVWHVFDYTSHILSLTPLSPSLIPFHKLAPQIWLAPFTPN